MKYSRMRKGCFPLFFLSLTLSPGIPPVQSKRGDVFGVRVFTGLERKDVKRSPERIRLFTWSRTRPVATAFSLHHQLGLGVGTADKVSVIPLFAGSGAPLLDNRWISVLLWDKNRWLLPMNSHPRDQEKEPRIPSLGLHTVGKMTQSLKAW